MVKIVCVEPTAYFDFDTSSDTLLHKIEKAARTCYRSEAGNKPAAQFIAGLIQKGHESVIEHSSLTATVVCSRSCSHQIVRHRLCSYSQESQRYVNYANAGYEIILPPEIELKDKALCSVYMSSLERSIEAYEEMIGSGIKPEDARYLLPNAFSTRIVMTANLRTWRHIFALRALNPHAQWEIRQCMEQLLSKAINYMPCCFKDMLEPTDSDVLRALEAAGVDNWDGYSIAYQALKRD
jgi:thymidylate synthase (FAD)